VLTTHEADRLALRARAGDADALTRLYGAFAPALMAYVERLTGDRAQAEDVVQETFLKVLENRGRYAAEGRFRQWLFTVAANAARSQVRRGHLLVRLDADPGTEAAVGATPSRATAPDVATADREHLRLIEKTLATLPPGYAPAFHLRLREGFSYREIAAITGEPEGTQRSRVHHALHRLREALEASSVTSEPKREGGES
jgi:RNA polymerase sigma-70 factor, ECF subfamily